ncbi:hypothetical protein OCAR_6412 [Afipia carboxidovorans OM5]|nr:hypothetical protein OCAR_6412 [Afipia carboxidovorans OM5]
MRIVQHRCSIPSGRFRPRRWLNKIAPPWNLSDPDRFTKPGRWSGIPGHVGSIFRVSRVFGLQIYAHIIVL